MYEAYWQLKQKPFENTTDARFYYPGEPHQAAPVEVALCHRKPPGGALAGRAAGAGKTLVTAMLPGHPRRGCTPLVIGSCFRRCRRPSCWPTWPSRWTVRSLLRPPRKHPPDRKFLSENTQRGRHAMLVVDEAHLMQSIHTLEALRLLLNFGRRDAPGMTFSWSASRHPANVGPHAAVGRASGGEMPVAAVQRSGDGRLRGASVPRGRRDCAIVDPAAWRPFTSSPTASPGGSIAFATWPC